ncbi:MAG: transposase [Defluviicoccus sp.]
MRAEVLVGAERRRRWSVDEKLRIVREAFAPGVLVAEVARRRDVSRAQIYQWRAALRRERLTEAGTGIVGFVPVDVAASATMEQPATGVVAADWVIEIGLAGGRSLKVLSSLPTADLRRLIRAVEDA